MLFLKGYMFLLIVLMVYQKVNSDSPQKILLSVFYESKCPYSKKFVLNQLQPAMQLLYHYVKLQFIPFGKARSINNGDDGFECQHGPSECLGNIVQDCSLFYMKHASDLERLEYVACEMATEDGTRGDLGCVRQANLSENVIEQCVLNGKGTKLQLESEYFTNIIHPAFVPTVTVNGIFDQKIQDNATKDLFGTICSIIPKIPPCLHHYN
ncbi:gamma-interferon-inducible lysosomal thiol reductase-like [Epargyreus clarus]|uniref:gamma-interferon-inducible lysosomal thiol reductase-like n=1 Tax=Epargyreus clarus TaxID=520877 RepID=UPI003C307914